MKLCSSDNPSTMTPINLFNISCLFSDRTTTPSTFHEFTSRTGFRFIISSAIFFPINSPVAPAVLWPTILEAAFAASSPTFARVSNIFFFCICQRFLANDKNPYPLTYFIVLGFIEERVISVY